MDNNKKPKLSAYEDIFTPTASTEQNKETTNAIESVVILNIDDILPCPNHPYNVVEDDDMIELSQNIKAEGVLVPIAVRKMADGTYQLLAGHRRTHASKMAGLTAIPAIVKDVDDDKAVRIMVSTNKPRKILPSELARAYKMYYESVKKTPGTRTDLSGGEGENTRDIAAESLGISSTKFWRYMCLADLVIDFLGKVDESKIAIGAGQALSALSEGEQEDVLCYLSENNTNINEAQAKKLKDSSKEKPLTEAKIAEILQYKKPQAPKAVKISYKKIKDYVPSDVPPKELENLIVTLLKQHYGKEETTFVNTE